MPNSTFLNTDFKALTGHRPFRWQSRLFDHLMDGQPPEAVDVPTGLGKTSVMALWLIALARGADLPRRLIYVVDRRAVVDQATRFAADLCENLPSDLAEKLAVADAGLPVSTLRGGKADNRDWLDDPSKPAIVVGTIDMVGSRLLFEGYGVSRGMRPYQAGFVGADALFVLDEAHLCPPFEALLREVENHRDGTFGPVRRHAAPDAITPPVRLMSLSATGRSAPAGGRTIFRLSSDDREEELVQQRLNAAKRLGLHLLDDPKKLREELAERAIALGFGTVPRRVVVYCDQRRVALEVKKLIDREIKARAKKPPDVPAAKSELLVGARRVRERERVEDWLDDVGLLGSAEAPPPASPVFLVATSAGEVGIDMDADHMVCDLVAFERMVQRLGRVNRRGGADRTALVDVVCAPPAKSAQEKALAEHEARVGVLRALVKGAEGRYDASPEALGGLKSRSPDLVASATTPPPLHPPLTRPHLEAWAMTSLIEHEGRTEVEPWLRGWEEDEEPQVEVVWRAHLPHLRVGDDVTVPPSMVAEFFQAAPIHATEKLETSRSHLLDWLFKRTKLLKQAVDGPRSEDIVATVLDHSGALVASKTLGELAALVERPEQNREKRALEQRRRDWERQLAGATLVLDARVGGLDADGMLNERQDGVPVVADAADDWAASADADAPPIRFRIVRASGSDAGSNDADGEWLLNRTFEVEHTDAGDGERLEVYKWAIEPTDEDSRSIQTRPQALHEHAEQVAAKARQIAERLRLPATEVDALEHAARFHDDGKAAVRWQEAMNAPRCGRPYAKTRGGGNWRRLEGYRHEFGSLLKAEKADLPADTRDLILHLIAAHHGHARPVIATAGCDEAPPTLLAASAREAGLRFAYLQRRYGVWGLAWREAILRAADQSASREWAKAKRGNSG